MHIDVTMQIGVIGEIGMYKRFMIFEWSDYDNTAPLSCVESSFLLKNVALHYAKKMKHENDYLNYCVFDRSEGIVIWQSGSNS